MTDLRDEIPVPADDDIWLIKLRPAAEHALGLIDELLGKLTTLKDAEFHALRRARFLLDRGILND